LASACFSWPPVGLHLASTCFSWPPVGLRLASAWPPPVFPGLRLASAWPPPVFPGLRLASAWPPPVFPGLRLASAWPPLGLRLFFPASGWPPLGRAPVLSHLSKVAAGNWQPSTRGSHPKSNVDSLAHTHHPLLGSAGFRGPHTDHKETPHVPISQQGNYFPSSQRISVQKMCLSNRDMRDLLML
jgi:hypothetical protein